MNISERNETITKPAAADLPDAVIETILRQVGAELRDFRLPQAAAPEVITIVVKYPQTIAKINIQIKETAK